MSTNLTFSEYDKLIEDLDLYGEDLIGDLGVVTGLVSEVGEYNNLITKMIRGDERYAEASVVEPLAKKELGDILWYLCRTCRRTGFTFEEVAQTNLDKLFDRRDRGVLRGDGDDR